MLTLDLRQLTLNEVKLLFAILWPSAADVVTVKIVMDNLRQRMGRSEAEKFFDTVENEVLVKVNQ